MKHFILADYRDGLYYAALNDKLEREYRRCTGYSHAQVFGTLAYVAGLTRKYYTHTAAVAALAKLDADARRLGRRSSTRADTYRYTFRVRG